MSLIEPVVLPRSTRVCLLFPAAQAALFVLLSAVLRVILLLKFGSKLTLGAGEYFRMFAVGLLLDAAVAAVVFFPLMAWLATARRSWLERPWHQALLLAGTWFCWVLLIFLFQAEYFFFEEYASRFNTVAIDYLHYWTEVRDNISTMYPVKTVIAISVVGASAVAWLLWSQSRAASSRLRGWLGAMADGLMGRWERLAQGGGKRARFAACFGWLAAGSAVLLSAADWLAGRWAWPPLDGDRRTRLVAFGGWLAAGGALLLGASRVDFQASDERLANELASNGLTNGMIALWTRDLDYAHFFPTLPREEAFARARKLLDSPGAVWTSDPFSLQRRIPGDPAKKRLNVIVLVQESFGSEFWGCLNLKNGKPKKNSLTPQLDELAAREGMLFTHLFADGNRTVRGLEGILSSIPPLPGDAILARTKSQGCDTLATVLGRDGYETTFIYGGRGLFDGMKPFMLDNGFQRFIEGGDFENPKFSTIWGHCDEDLYDRVLEEARTTHASGKPFLLTAMSVSNHQPFIFPPHSTDPKWHGHKAGARYSDHALGRFFGQAKNEPFWQDTIFVVVADHGARVYGSQTVPVLSYEIPLLILGPSVVSQPRRIDTLGCQLDVAPTLLGLIGRPYDSVFYGRDLLTPAASRFALLNHNRSIALYREPELVALSLGKVIERYTRTDRKTLIRQPLDAATEEMSREATALFQTADELYTQRRYAVDPSAPLFTQEAPPRDGAETGKEAEK